MIEGFEWHAVKAAINLEKHGISFEEAATVFWDENALLIADTEHSDDEERFVLLGMSEHLRILVVVHCERGDNIRIISARRATNNETKQYGR
ncbi:BrnT family toxin [Kingella kingae]|uniref:BrnT family toxin n=1 Tax=Kingella kingae TaxID=504 RepID=UPI0002E1C989|nr:BrnT family toxin [Kingella kingae]MDK4555450.1 BrnT family toxin [Kingella kingae]MDK4576490.1 BrnT family toxin [Kingella kingae]MDK4582561.1 BrnT family toxin [Kingella kingae]MDK4584528.1 BrnT family toxin [Kingella kingae]MDK4588524.1 BrnT family toxin [Kingella kingae]